MVTRTYGRTDGRTDVGSYSIRYQTCTSDIKGQSVGKFYIFGYNWRSLKPFLSRVILTIKTTTMDKSRSGNENYDLFCSLKVKGLAT